LVIGGTIGLPSVATERTTAGDQRYYVCLPDGTLLYSLDAAGNTRHFYHFDEAGNTIFLTDDQGAVTDSYGITPYGESVTHNGSSDNPFTWQGAFGVIQEGSTGLYYLRARYHDAATGRFLSKDPLAASDPMQTNPYLFAVDNPIMYTDPLGTSPPMQFVNALSDTIFQPNGSYTPVIVGAELKDLGILGWQFAQYQTQEFTTFARGIDAHFNAIADGLVSIEQAERLTRYTYRGCDRIFTPYVLVLIPE
jgi:RHS repeat-associated protein